MKAHCKVEDQRHKAVLSVSLKSIITSVKLAPFLPLKPAAINNFPVVLHGGTAEKTERRVPSTCELCACKCGEEACGTGGMNAGICSMKLISPVHSHLLGRSSRGAASSKSGTSTQGESRGQGLHVRRCPLKVQCHQKLSGKAGQIKAGRQIFTVRLHLGEGPRNPVTTSDAQKRFSFRTRYSLQLWGNAACTRTQSLSRSPNPNQSPGV